MPSPLPGMDPYLEDARVWPLFQRQLILSLQQLLLPGLADRYRARVGQRAYVTEQALFTSVVREEHHEDFLEIRHRSSSKLVTHLEVVSPANKTLEAARQAYLARRADARAAGASLVEIDLVLQGQPTLDYSRDGLPEWDYVVTVTRPVTPERHEVYTTTLAKKLPRFRLPLAADDRDTVLDLQAAFSRAYDQGDFADEFDYARDPATRLSDAQRAWLNDLLTQQKKR